LRSRRFSGRFGRRSLLADLPIYLLIFVLVAIASYGSIDKIAKLGDGLGLLVSFNKSQFGLYLDGVSIGYLTIALVVVLLVIVISNNRKSPIRLTSKGVSAVVVLALVCGAAFAVSQTQTPSPWPNHISNTSGDFTLNIYYGPTYFRAGNNISLEYVLTNNAYTTTVYYLDFGGQFSMVFYNSHGQIVKAYKAPISFQLSQGQDYIAFVPGQTWTKLLSWNGDINNTSGFAPSGNYTLASYAVLQDANASLYVVLNTKNLTIGFNN
jgi:hypothetical protein